MTAGLLGSDEAERAAWWLSLVRACAANGDDLVRDATLLLDHGRFARGLSLSVLAIEEYGKSIEALIVIGAGGAAEETADFRRRQSSHRPKLEAGQVWTAIVSPNEPLDDSFVERSRRIVEDAALAKMSGFYVDGTDDGLRTPDKTDPAGARGYLSRAQALGTHVHNLVSQIVGEQELHALWRFGPDLIAMLVAASGQPNGAESTEYLRSLLPKFGIPLIAGQPDPDGSLHFLGVDLAWADAKTMPNETGLVLLNSAGTVLEAGWTRGVAQTLEWIHQHVTQPHVLAFVDAPLIVNNAVGQRLCETQVGQRYGRWQVSANSTNMASRNAAGILLLEGLLQTGWRYDDGLDGPATSGRHVSECYPYTTIVGTPQLGYDTERPRYKRKPRGMLAGEWRPTRAAACDELLFRMGTLAETDPPLDLGSHAVTAELLLEPSPILDVAYKHREDLIDAALCAWTASLWARHGFARSQVLGDPEERQTAATIIAPTRWEQRGSQPASVRTSAART